MPDSSGAWPAQEGRPLPITGPPDRLMGRRLELISATAHFCLCLGGCAVLVTEPALRRTADTKRPALLGRLRSGLNAQLARCHWRFRRHAQERLSAPRAPHPERRVFLGHRTRRRGEPVRRTGELVEAGPLGPATRPRAREIQGPPPGGRVGLQGTAIPGPRRCVEPAGPPRCLGLRSGRPVLSQQVECPSPGAGPYETEGGTRPTAPGCCGPWR